MSTAGISQSNLLSPKQSATTETKLKIQQRSFFDRHPNVTNAGVAVTSVGCGTFGGLAVAGIGLFYIGYRIKTKLNSTVDHSENKKPYSRVSHLSFVDHHKEGAEPFNKPIKNINEFRNKLKNCQSVEELEALEKEVHEDPENPKITTHWLKTYHFFLTHTERTIDEHENIDYPNYYFIILDFFKEKLLKDNVEDIKNKNEERYMEATKQLHSVPCLEHLHKANEIYTGLLWSLP